MTKHAVTTDESSEESFLSVLYDITKKHPVIFIALFMLPLIALLISLGMKWHYVFSDTTHYLRNFSMDSTGVWSDTHPYISPGVDRDRKSVV